MELVRAFCPDPLASLNVDLEPRRWNADVLGSRGQEVHLHPGLRLAPHGPVREATHVEIASQLAIDAHEEVAVECRRHSERVILGQQEIALGPDQIGAQEQQVP